MKFRRKSVVEDTGEQDAETGAAEVVGPFDADDLPDDGVARVDLGSLLIAPEEGKELRLQVDETTGTVQAVLLAGADGAIEIRAFAAPRHGDLWAEVRPQIAADMAQRGGTATESEGRFGTELQCQVSVQLPDGSAGIQPSRIVGVNGPRWLLRATLLGRPAMDSALATEWEDVLTRVAVRRGGHALPVGEPLPLVLPENARRVGV
ncbi:DUF3710 domain-containing protein [Nocardioides sp. R-C-SC26]|uniref:DUF3710 domain-containing protein n=1 Tax=Nocardioides sp. R-C-SC26 TaxID=2870414 RepID=UPI001E57B36D|nr:DUF3710 domain-containing protein [Nocardioides sp. R-C-SC26]